MFRFILFLIPIIITLGWLFYAAYLFPFLGVTLLIGLVFNIIDGRKYRWFSRLAYSLDQTYNAYWSVYLNIVMRPSKHLFGHPDETVSSVIGKNLLESEDNHWVYTEKALKLILERNKRPHSVRGIEKDEGYTK
mgnify:CR=1 FL=1